MKHLIILLLALLPIKFQAQSQIILNSTDESIGAISSISLTRLPSGSTYDLAGLSNDDIYFFKTRPNEAGDSVRYEYHRLLVNRLYEEDQEHAVNLGAEGEKSFKSSRYFDLLKVHDVNGDGLLDLIVLLSKEMEIHWCKNEGFTRFAQPVPLSESMNKMKTMNSTHISGENFIYKYDKGLGYINLIDPTDFILIKSKDLEPYYISGVADMDNDSIPDFMLFDQNKLSLLLTAEQSLIATNVEIADPYYSCYADINNDGLVDVINTFDNTIQIHYNEGNGKFRSPKRILDDNIVKDRVEDLIYDYDLDWSVNTFDCDGDGDQDIIAFGVYILLLKNNGDGTFNIQQLGDRAYDLDALVIEDVDYDGDLDFFYNSHEGLALFENRKGIFAEIRTLEICSYAEFYYWIDLDKDGDQDLLMKDMCDTFLYWSERTDKGLTKPVIYQVAVKDL